MSEDRERLQRALQDLRTQLQAQASLAPEASARLTQTISEVESALAQPGLLRDQQPTLAHRLSDATLDFEASHPTLAGSLGSVIDALSRMGI